MRIKIFIATASIFAVIVLAISCMGDRSEGEKNAIPKTVSYNFDVRPILSDRCFACHGPDVTKQQAGLRLDIRDSALRPLKETKGSFAIVPGKPEQSEIVKRISSKDPAYQMPTPESHLALLEPYQINIIKKWISQGAKYEKHWAFIKPVKSKVPEIDKKSWAINEIDHFIYEKMKRKGLEPNKQADDERLLKRISLDLTGLPPSIETMDRLAGKDVSKEYERIVDQLMASPKYGEKMAVHWLDVARYADSYGYQDDDVRTQWPYRDWVIHAFNKNIPYDKFVTMQIAGDKMPGGNKENHLATAFLRNHKYTEEGGVIDEEYRVEYLIDKTKTYGKGLLGLTVECAQCHTHKYDPITQSDYYSLLAFFNNTEEEGIEGTVGASDLAKKPYLRFTGEEISKIYSFINYDDTAAITVSVMEDKKGPKRKTHILDRGLYSSPGEVVEPSALQAVMPFDTSKYSRDRKGLAEWTVNRDNPLTARVFVNQVWHELFGNGLVKSSGDFGMQGELPTHPELLDWLAVDFMEHNWDIKYLVKKIVMSATYRQSSVISQKQKDSDPDNFYYSRYSRNRVGAEFVRDIILSSSGLLDTTIGGPSVKPYQPSGLWEASTSGRGQLASYRQDHDNSLYRRGMYTFIKLTLPPPSMIMFDASNRDQCEVKRLKTNTPLQALIMMNDPTVLEASRVLAERLTKENAVGDDGIRKAFRKIVSRQPTGKELKTLSDYYADQLKEFKSGKLNEAMTLKTGEYAHISGIDQKTAAAMMKTITLIYNLEETLSKT